MASQVFLGSWTSPFGLVLKQLHDVTPDQQIFGLGNELAVQPAGLVLQTGFAAVPIRGEHHHPSSLFGEYGMADQIRNPSDVFLHTTDNVLDVLIREGLTDDHSGKHGLLLSGC
jgi:hypothetical protein